VPVPKRSRAELVEAVRSGFQRTSGQSTILSQVISDKIGLAPSACGCLSFLDSGGPMTAGRLAELTGLTSGAVTRMIDRLEAAKYVRRRRDPSDRRKTIIELVPGWERDFEPFYGPLARGTAGFLAGYSDAELVLFAGLLDRMVDYLQQHAERIQAVPAKPKRKNVRLRAKILGQSIRIEV